MNKLNEKEIINLIHKKLPKHKFISEDVEVIKFGKTNFVLKVDTLVQSTDVPPGMSFADVARKSVVSPVSDFASKGVKPQFGIISLTFPKTLSRKKIKDLAVGFAKASKEFNLKIIGGDTNEGKELVIQVSLFGTTKKIIARKGAKLNDIIVATGPFGYTAAGLKIILKKKKSTNKFSKKAKNSVFRPLPRLNFGITNARFFSSSMDSSDGLSSTLHEMSNQSQKKFVINKLPTSNDLVEFSRKNRLDPLKLIFHGGEEFEIIFTTNPANFSKIKQRARLQKIPLIPIGIVKKGKGVVYKTETKTIRIQDKGWVHFRS